MNKTLIVPVTLTTAVLILAGCDKSSTQEHADNLSTNGASTNLMYTNSMATNDWYTNSLATNISTGGAGAWNDTRNMATNAWQTAKEGGSNAWQETKEISTNVWDKTKEAFGGISSLNEISTNYFAYDYSMKDNFVSEAQTNLIYLDSRISSLSAKMDNNNNPKPDFRQAVQAVKDRRADVGVKYDAVKSATADNWNDIKAAYVKSYLDLTAALETAWNSAKVSQ